MKQTFAKVAVAVGLVVGSTVTAAANQVEAASPTVILVHGAWADGSGWSKVIKGLQQKGIKVVAVQHPLTSLEDDVAATQRAIDAATGPVILVGHSYGGVVITEAGKAEKVKSLVYIAAFAPDQGQALLDLGGNLPPPPGVIGLAPDKAGFFTLSPSSFAQNFAQDLPKADALVLAAEQGPTSIKALTAKVTVASWSMKKTYYMVATHDRMIQPDLERQFAEKMKATTVEVPSSHLAMLSHPAEVTRLILTAVEELSN